MLAALAFVLAQPKVDVKFEVGFRPIANLTYQLDVLSGVLPHDAPLNFKALWEREFLKTAEDRQALDLWRARRKDMGKVFEPKEAASAVRFPIERFGPIDDSEAHIRSAAFDAADLRDYRRRILAVSNREAATDLSYVVAHFLPAYEDWWKRVPSAEGDVFARDLRGMLDSTKMRSTLARFVQFYRPQLDADPTIRFVLLYRPNEIKEPTSGQQLGPYSVVQFLPGETPADRVDIALHELAHYFYGQARPQDLAALQGRLLRSPNAIPAYNLLNESLATALGNIVVGEQISPPGAFAKSLAEPMGFYHDADIDRGGKSVFGWIKPYLEKGGSLFDPEFADLYLAGLDRTFGPRLAKPKISFSRMFSFMDESIPGLSPNILYEHFSLSTLWLSRGTEVERRELQGYLDNPTLSGLFLVTPKQLDRLVASGVISGRERDLLKSAPQPSLLATRRNAHSIAYVAVVRTSEEAAILLRRISSLERFEAGIVPSGIR